MLLLGLWFLEAGPGLDRHRRRHRRRRPFLVGRAKKAGRAQTQLTKELVSLLTDTLDNLKPLKAMGAQQEFVEFFDRRLHRLRRAPARQVINREALRNGQDALLALCMGVAAYLAIAILNTSLER